MKLATILALALSVLVAHADDKLPVASLTTVLTDLAQNIGGDRVSVTAIVKPGVDPHEFEPSPSDLTALSQAKVILASGLGFESYLGRLQQMLRGPTIIVVGDSMKSLRMAPEEGAKPDADGQITDPHWFHSLPNARIATRVIRDAFIAADPAGKDTYTANAAAFLAQLDALAQWERLQIATLPVDRRILVTSHDALGYFARDNDFKIYPIEGISTTDQPSSKKVRELIEEIKSAGVKAIFAENIENPKVLTEITRETGAKLGGTIYADGLGDTEANTYDAMIRHNVTTIVNGLK